MVPAEIAQLPDPDTLVSGLVFPEAPRWHAGSLYLTDVLAGRILRIASDGALETLLDVPGRPGGLGFDPEGRLLFVEGESRTLRRLRSGPPPTGEVVADLSALSESHLNDMVVDAKGRAYIGNYGFDLVGGAPEAPAQIFRVDPDGRVSVAAEDLRMPNGMVITADGRSLIAAESWGTRLSIFEIAPDGRLGDRRDYAVFDRGLPDGLDIDCEDAVWMADPIGRVCRRVRADGAVTHEVRADDRRIFACALGGADGRTLFLCTGANVDPAQAQANPSGAIETLRVPVPGRTAR